MVDYGLPSQLPTPPPTGLTRTVPANCFHGMIAIRRATSIARGKGTIARSLPAVVQMLLCCMVSLSSSNCRAESTAAELFQQQIEPVLTDHCYECHGYGMAEGGMELDQFGSGEDAVRHLELWWKVLKQLRAGLMPPPEHERPSLEQIAQLEQWIKLHVFEIDPNNPDPGRVTVRRLNRVEYRNTIRDLLGVDYDTELNFPPDDTGHGFDNIGDVLTISPLLLEKYVTAAEEIVSKAVPAASQVPAEYVATGQQFRPEGAKKVDPSDYGPLWLSYYVPAWVSHQYDAKHAGTYEIVVDLQADEDHVGNVFDYNRCRVGFKSDDEELLSEEFSRQRGRPYQFRFKQAWQPGPHRLTFELEPLTPNLEQVSSLTLRIKRVTVRGPLEKEFWVPPRKYRRFFPRDVPEDTAKRLDYARELLQAFASRAYRRPVDRATADRLATLAEQVYSQPDQSFEAGIAEAMSAVLVSPRFLYREEAVEPDDDGKYPLLDECALASRLSYFLWSTMPDEDLFWLASEKKLRKNLSRQVARMTADSRWQEFIRQFTGQWLRARDVHNVEINSFAVFRRDQKPDPKMSGMRRRLRQLRQIEPGELTEEQRAELMELREALTTAFRSFRGADLDDPLRLAMRRETELSFEYVFRKNRSLLELIDCDYTFVNDRLARHYGIEGIEGDHMRLVYLPPDSPRGGVLTQGTMLTTTSNPNRTSPVKRGVFILENILGVPPAPPPPNVPPLENEEQEGTADPPTLREALEIHRSDPLCSSCHDRMDPLGLALENFNALGIWRELDRGKPIDPSGELITGQSFHNIRELKRILVEDHHRDFYRCLTEKMLTFAIGRGLEYYDVQAVDTIVEKLEASGGRADELLYGIIESAPFQRSRRQDLSEDAVPTDRVSQTQVP